VGGRESAEAVHVRQLRGNNIAKPPRSCRRLSIKFANQRGCDHAQPSDPQWEHHAHVGLTGTNVPGRSTIGPETGGVHLLRIPESVR
jgi:hypothetical protein